MKARLKILFRPNTTTMLKWAIVVCWLPSYWLRTG